MNTYFQNIINDYYKKTNTNPLRMLNVPLSTESSNKYGMIAHEYTGNQKHAKSIDLLTPQEAMHLPYGRRDKKDMIDNKE